MKAIFSRCHALFGLLALVVLAGLLGGVAAHEDPDEAYYRSYLAQLHSFRERYKAAYVFDLEKHPHYMDFKILQEYPKRITLEATHLQDFGNGQRVPITQASDVPGKLRAIDSNAKSLALGPFHPGLIESQPTAVRQQHYKTFRDLTAWIEANYGDLVNLEGLRETASRLQRYKSMRRLAEIARDVPQP
ncbi:hypothetical protein NDA16_000018 [Ustilago loliicola]|nr:hypothetical protein NDA16_000018 [Ustilago loliicola]